MIEALQSHPASRWLAKTAYVLGIISAYSTTSRGGNLSWRVSWVRWRGRRPYILGRKREWWARFPHRVKHGHWPTDVGYGVCGACVPWPCCGATGIEHTDDCEERNEP